MLVISRFTNDGSYLQLAAVESPGLKCMKCGAFFLYGTGAAVSGEFGEMPVCAGYAR